MALLTNGFVRRDANSEIGFLPPTTSEALMLNDGSTMPASAFKEDYPVTKYTPKELGMNIEASPFYNPDKANAAGAVPSQPSGSGIVAEDTQAAATNVLEADEALQIVSFGASSAVSSFNSWAASNIGFLLLGAGVLYAVYQYGVRRGVA